MTTRRGDDKGRFGKTGGELLAADGELGGAGVAEVGDECGQSGHPAPDQLAHLRRNLRWRDSHNSDQRCAGSGLGDESTVYSGAVNPRGGRVDEGQVVNQPIDGSFRVIDAGRRCGVQRNCETKQEEQRNSS
jgi:hypothetical protein